MRRITIHRAGVRPHLFLGADREMVLSTGLIAGVLINAGIHSGWYLIAGAVLLWFGALFVLRRIARSDPLARQVFLRHLLYARYYPAHSRPYRVNRAFPSSSFSK